jgi:spore coat polysaccharide biosynthesis protein SpsF
MVLLTVRTGSSRLKNKCFLPFGDTTLLGHSILRAKYFGLHPIVCTSTEIQDDLIAEFCLETNTDFFRGSLNNKLFRWLECAKSFNLENFHIIDVDDPFFNPILIKESLDIIMKSEVGGVLPTKVSANGLGSVGYSLNTQALIRKSETFQSISDLEMVDGFFLKLENFPMIELNSKISEPNELRLTVDYQEDYELLSFVVRELGHYCSNNELNNFFVSNPDLYKFNIFRNRDWSKRQNDIRAKEAVLYV